MRPPSDITPPELVGSAYFDANTWANGGLWADAFANFGLAGILVFSIGLGVVLWLLDVVADGTDLAITGSVVAIISVILTNTAFLTATMSHGLGLLILAYSLMPRERQPGEDPLDAAHRAPTPSAADPPYLPPRIRHEGAR
jgi:hypothetical protein